MIFGIINANGMLNNIFDTSLDSNAGPCSFQFGSCGSHRVELNEITSPFVRLMKITA